MQKRTTLLGTVCVLAAAFVAGPAAAATLTDWTGSLASNYTHQTGTSHFSWNQWDLDGSAAGPLGFPNFNLQADAGYIHGWRNGHSQEGEFFGGSLFWAGDDGRIGVNAQYNTFTHAGHLTSGGAFGEWYFGPVTVDARAGWLSSGGTVSQCFSSAGVVPCGSGVGGGHGNYVGGDVTFYALPDLAITGGIDLADRITGSGCQVCGRTDINNLTYSGEAEFLVNLFTPISVTGLISYTQLTHGNGHITTFGVRLKWYPGAPTLMDAHRSGTLHTTLTGS